MSAARIVAVVGIALALASCVARTTYDWGRYDPALYSYYKDPAKLAELEDSLQAVINDADKRHTRVPPGIYAEYGYLRLQDGQTDKAISLFKEEQVHWPESRQFMERMIQVASKPSTASGSTPSNAH